MTTRVVIAIKAPVDGKSRLADVLTEPERMALIHAMLDNVVATAKSARGIDAVWLASPPLERLDGDLPVLADRENGRGGLNGAASNALCAAAASGVSRLVLLPADLPQLAAHDVEMLAAASDSLSIAPDRHGTGTNALSLPVPAALDFVFSFGTDSFARHCAEAKRLGLRVKVVHSPGLARDIDLPADLPDAVGIWQVGVGLQRWPLIRRSVP